MRVEPALIVFVVAGVVITVIILVVGSILGKGDVQSSENTVLDSTPSAIDSVEKSSQELLVDYKEAFSRIKADLSVEGTKEFLFQTRVPKEYLDAHLQGAIAFGNLDYENLTNEEFTNGLKQILDDLEI